jgi:hypothetical protein
MADTSNDGSSGNYVIVTSSDESCEICYSGHSFDKVIPCKCGHVFCKACLTKYYNLRVLDNKLYPFKCPMYECKEDIHESLGAVLEKNKYKHFVKIRKQRALLTDPNVKWCPVVNCKGYGKIHNKHRIKCNKCDCEISKTKRPDESDILNNFSVIECPGCGCYVSRTFGCLKANCYCGTEFCMKCGKVVTQQHNYWICLVSDHNEKISVSLIVYILFASLLAPFFPFFLLFFYRKYIDKNYIKQINKSPKCYQFLIFIFSPLILVLSAFYLPFVWSWWSLDWVFETRYKLYRIPFIILKLALYLPCVILIFLAYLLGLSLLVFFLPLYGLGLVIYLVFYSGKKAKPLAN